MVMAQELNRLPKALEGKFPVQDLNPEIVGGNVANPEDYEYYAKWWPNPGCGGALIWEDVVFSAAHCVRQKGSGILNSRTIYIGSEEVPATIMGRILHPDWDERNLSWDFVVMKLLEPIQNAVLLPLNNDFNSPSGNDVLTVMGFGDTTDLYGQYSDVLMEVDVIFVDHDTCDDQNYGRIDEESMMCAADINKDACAGDSGGPLIDANGYSIGVVSWGFGCARPDLPGVYSRTSAAYDWVQEQICLVASHPPSNCPSPSSEGTSYDSTVTVYVEATQNPESMAFILTNVATGSVVGSADAVSIVQEFETYNFVYSDLSDGLYSLEVYDHLGEGNVDGFVSLHSGNQPGVDENVVVSDGDSYTYVRKMWFEIQTVPSTVVTMAPSLTPPSVDASIAPSVDTSIELVRNYNFEKEKIWDTDSDTVMYDCGGGVAASGQCALKFLPTSDEIQYVVKAKIKKSYTDRTRKDRLTISYLTKWGPSISSSYKTPQVVAILSLFEPNEGPLIEKFRCQAKSFLNDEDTGDYVQTVCEYVAPESYDKITLKFKYDTGHRELWLDTLSLRVVSCDDC